MKKGELQKANRASCSQRHFLIECFSTLIHKILPCISSNQLHSEVSSAWSKLESMLLASDINEHSSWSFVTTLSFSLAAITTSTSDSLTSHQSYQSPYKLSQFPSNLAVKSSDPTLPFERYPQDLLKTKQISLLSADQIIQPKTNEKIPMQLPSTNLVTNTQAQPLLLQSNRVPLVDKVNSSKPISSKIIEKNPSNEYRNNIHCIISRIDPNVTANHSSVAKSKPIESTQKQILSVTQSEDSEIVQTRKKAATIGMQPSELIVGKQNSNSIGQNTLLSKKETIKNAKCPSSLEKVFADNKTSSANIQWLRKPQVIPSISQIKDQISLNATPQIFFNAKQVELQSARGKKGFLESLFPSTNVILDEDSNKTNQNYFAIQTVKNLSHDYQHLSELVKLRIAQFKSHSETLNSISKLSKNLSESMLNNSNSNNNINNLDTGDKHEEESILQFLRESGINVQASVKIPSKIPNKPPKMNLKSISVFSKTPSSIPISSPSQHPSSTLSSRPRKTSTTNKNATIVSSPSSQPNLIYQHQPKTRIKAKTLIPQQLI